AGRLPLPDVVVLPLCGDCEEHAKENQPGNHIMVPTLCRWSSAGDAGVFPGNLTASKTLARQIRDTGCLQWEGRTTIMEAVHVVEDPYAGDGNFLPRASDRGLRQQSDGSRADR